ncbi:MAG: hypothetical protein ACF8MJ_12845 [Phycisphaerales bacterium JB050]
MLGYRQLDLWSLLPSRRKPKLEKTLPKSAPTVTTRVRAVRPNGPKPGTMQHKYQAMERELLAEYGVRVRKWRTSMSGVAWEVHYRDGTVSRLIESPRPKGPMSAAVFCHEIGHHAIGFKTYRPRCLEEYHAWAWSLRTMAQYELNITQSVRDRMHDSLHYAVLKAERRGLKSLPAELEPFARPRSRSPRANAGIGKPIA